MEKVDALMLDQYVPDVVQRIFENALWGVDAPYVTNPARARRLRSRVLQPARPSRRKLSQQVDRP